MIVFINITGSMAILFAFYLFSSKRRVIPFFDFSFLLLLIFMFAFFISNYLEWSMNIKAVDVYESFLLPMLWSFFFFNMLIKNRVFQLKKTQNELYEANRRFNLVIETIQDIFWLETPDLKEQIFISSGFDNVFGTKQSDITINKNLAHCWFDLVSEEQRNKNFQVIYNSINNRTHYSLQYQIINTDGTVNWILEKGYPVENKQGEIDLMAGVCTNITERKIAELALQEKEERLELAITAAQLGTWDWDIQSGRAVYNQRWGSMLGYNLQEINNEINFWERLIHPDDSARVLKNLKDHLNGSSPFFESEYRLQAKSGEWIWVLTKGKVIQRDPANRPVRACGTHLDISERKKNQQEMKLYLDKIEEQKRFIQRVFDTSPNILFIMDIQKKSISSWNKRSAAITGYSNEEIAAMGKDFLPKIIYHDDLPNFLKNLERIKYSKDEEILQAEYRIKKADGELQWFSTYSTPFLKNESGEVIQILVVASNINSQKEIERRTLTQQEHLRNLNEKLMITNQELDSANNRLRELDLLKNDFIAMASHELRTPVTTVMGFAQTLLTPGLKISEQKRNEFLKIIEKEAVRLSRLLGDLLNLSNIEAGFGSVEMKCVNLSSIINDAIAKLHPGPEKRVIFFDDKEIRKQVQCNRDQIRDVFVHIIENALRYGDEIVINVIEEKNNVEVSIHDNGPGVPGHLLKVIFEKFYRVQGEQRPGGGSGLGLAIAKDIIVAHGGKIWAESKPGEGSAFYFTLKKC